MALPTITIQCQTSHDPFSTMAFSANWTDETHRYHVWIGLRPDVEGSRPAYPVAIGGTIYKNTIADSRHINTKQLDITAAAHAKIKAEIKRIATYDALMQMYKNARAEFDGLIAMYAEANRLNAIFNAYTVLLSSDIDEKELMYLHAARFYSKTH